MSAVNRQKLSQHLRRDIESCGFYPELVIDSLATALGSESVLHYFVHQEAMFGAELHRHLTVLATTPTRLLISHTDESSDEAPRPAAISSLESVSLDHISLVSLTRVVASPEVYPHDPSESIETWLKVNWGTVNKVELEHGRCPDPDCEADHGLVGTIFGEDLLIRVSPAADGFSNVEHLVTFATDLQQSVGTRP